MQLLKPIWHDATARIVYSYLGVAAFSACTRVELRKGSYG